MRFALGLFLALCSAGTASAQPALSGPVEGYTFDGPTRSFRAVIGFPGASSFGPALLNGLDAGSVAPQRNYGLAFQNGQCVFVSGLDTGNALAATIAGVPLQPEDMTWSSDGSMAILYSRAASWFQVLTGFPHAPSAAAPVNVATLGGALRSIAADPRGQRIAVGVKGTSGAVYWTADRKAFLPLFSMTNPIALAFSADGSTVYAVDGDAQRVTAAGIQNSGLRTFSLGLADPVAILPVAETTQREVLYVAGRSDKRLRVFDLTSQQELPDIALAFQPTRLDPLGGNSLVLAARSESHNPLWLFTTNPAAQAYFVPAVQLPSTGLLGVGGTE